MAKVFKITNMDKVREHYPHFKAWGDGYFFQLANDGFYVINSLTDGFLHSRIIYPGPKQGRHLHFGPVRMVSEFIYGKHSVALYILPGGSANCGMNTEHIFTRPELGPEYADLLSMTSDDEPAYSKQYSDRCGVNYNVDFFEQHDKHFKITSDWREGQFDFYKMMEIKNEFTDSEQWMAAPVLPSFGKNNVLHFYKWPRELPDLNKMYDYSKASKKLKPLEEFVKLEPFAIIEHGPDRR